MRLSKIAHIQMRLRRNSHLNSYFKQEGRVYRLATDIDKLCNMADDTITHKKLVLDNCHIMAKYLFSKNKIELATQLLRRGCDHDNSKIEPEEFKRLSQILKSRKCFTDAKESLSETERNAIKYHWEHNRHHPEYFENPSEEMTELDIIEMVCDWFARSLQYDTEFIPFVIERQANRFRFSDKKFKKILSYCELMERLYRGDKYE